MQTLLSKPLKLQFHQKIKSALPDFRKVGTDFGGVIYRQHDETGQRYIFIFLSPSPKLDRFTVELAVNSVPQYPFEILPGDKIERGAARQRIRQFFPNSGDGWWNLNRSHEIEPNISLHLQDRGDVQAALSKIPAAVQDAIEKVCGALPKFIRSLE